MGRWMQVTAAVTVLTLLAALAAFATAPPNIDTFDDAQAELKSTLGTTSPATAVTGSVTGSADNILGAERDVLVQATSGPEGGETKVSVQGSTFIHSQTTDTTGRSLLVYDGMDANTAVDYDGLCPSPSSDCVDLTQGDLSNGFRFSLMFDDLPVDVRIRVYDGSDSTGGKWSEETFESLFPGGVYSTGDYSPPFDVYVEFAAIAAGDKGSGGADFTNVGAVEFEFLGSVAATDFQIAVIDTYVLDWGDLPDSTIGTPGQYKYKTRFEEDGPRHVVNNLYMGSRVDPRSTVTGEFDGQPSLYANGDDLNNPGPGGADDEDGVRVNPITWSASNGGSLDVTVAGAPGCLSGWIDWNGDGDFDDALETVFTNHEVNSNKSYALSFNVPAGTMPIDTNESKTLYARFRLYPRNPKIGSYIPEGCTTPKTPDGRFLIPGGEVEDYQWTFTPTAVTLAALNASVQGEAIEVSWDTASEIDNAGFNLYRRTSEDGPETRLNASLIPAQAPGSPEGFHYAYLDDAGLAPGTTYWYTLEDVSSAGIATRHEPVSVAYGIGPNAVSISGFRAAAAVPAAPPVALAALCGLVLAAALRPRPR